MTANTPASALYTAAAVRALDQALIDAGTPAIQLMKQAGRAAFSVLLERFGEMEQLTVYTGGGNNGGDGFVVAALAASRRIPVNVILLTDPEQLADTAREAFNYARQEGVVMMPPGTAPTTGVIVDGLLGTGVKGSVRPDYAAVIRQINATSLPVLALDIPSGLDADTGAELGVAVKADLTVTFIGKKRGLYTGRGPAVAGEVMFAPLDAPLDLYQHCPADISSLDYAQMRSWLAARSADAHKGHFGHVMVIGGDTGRGGAALMAAEAAARTGAGLVSLATRPEHVAAGLARCPEVMICGVISGQELEPWLEAPSVLVVGPGLGQSPWSEQMLQQALATKLPLVVDADALNLLAAAGFKTQRENWILTPHPGEAGRLLGSTSAEVQADRFAAVARLQQLSGGTVILKGAGSLVAGPEMATNIIVGGNPGMASGGMGDVLSGVLGALLAQGLSFQQAANLGAAVHARAADRVVSGCGAVALLATDLIPAMGALLGE